MLNVVKFCVDYSIKLHVPPFDKIPTNSVKFQPCDCTACTILLSTSKIPM